MLYAKGLLDLQVAFAEKVQQLSDIPFERALLENTNLYVRLGLGRDFDPEQVGWRAYVAGVASAASVRDWTYRCYLSNAEANTRPAVVGTFGAFSYALNADGSVRLHFFSAEPGGRSPLGRGRDGERRADLAALCAHLKTTAMPAAAVVGGSWLYNLEAYRRLFPPVFVEARRAVHGKLQSMSLWGQFVDHRGALDAARAEAFSRALTACTSLEHLERCFPFQVLSARASVADFCAFYGV